MTITTTYPGVYVEELESTALSVSKNATAIPVFVINDKDKIFNKTTRINSWLDYINRLGEIGFDPKNTRDVSLRAYFENGGGYCYLVNSVNLLEEVPKLDDATLIVEAGEKISGLAELCGEGKNLFAILDGPVSDISVQLKSTNQENTPKTKNTESYTNLPTSKYAAAYYPWLSAEWANTPIPPSAAVAGAYCSNDRSRGVWKAPANMVLQGGLIPIFKVTDDIQGQYTKGDKAINMIRQFNNSDPTIWGARTLTVKNDDSWRYVSVRRLFNSVEHDIKNVMQFVMYEPNNQPTWERVRAAIENYLYGLWSQGAFLGNKPEEAYFVQIGKDITMTQDNILAGEMIVKIGLAAVRPAEYIILQFTQEIAQ